MDDAASEGADAFEEINSVLEDVIALMDDAEEGARQVAAANRVWKTTVNQLAAAYEELYKWMQACGAVAESPPMAAVAAGLITDAYMELARVVGYDLGQAFVSMSNITQEALGEIEIPEWLQQLDTLGKMGKGLDRVGAFFGKMVETDIKKADEQLEKLQTHIDDTAEEIEYLDWKLARPERFSQAELNKALTERAMLTSHLTSLQDEYNRSEAEQVELTKQLTALEWEQKNLDMLEQQVKLLDLIQQYGLDAKAILGDMKLGVDLDPLQMVQAMQRALREINIATLVKLDLAGFQHGGQFRVRGLGGPDTVPVSFMATPGEVVTVTPAGAMPPPNPLQTPVSNYNLTIHTSAPAESALSDFHTMRVLAGN